MTANYATEHAAALSQVRAKGADVTFTLASPGVQDDATGLFSGATTTTVSGAAIQSKGDGAMYRALGLVESEAPTLLFCPDTFGQQPALLSTIPWDGDTYTVRGVKPVRPAGTSILSRVVIAR